jgi:phage terminase large subunit GpA-like protein
MTGIRFSIPLWPRRPTRIKGKVPLFLIGVDAAKDALFAHLRLFEPGPGYLPFPTERDAEFRRAPPESIHPQSTAAKFPAASTSVHR